MRHLTGGGTPEALDHFPEDCAAWWAVAWLEAVWGGRVDLAWLATDGTMRRAWAERYGRATASDDDLSEMCDCDSWDPAWAAFSEWLAVAWRELADEVGKGAFSFYSVPGETTTTVGLIRPPGGAAGESTMVRGGVLGKALELVPSGVNGEWRVVRIVGEWAPPDRLAISFSADCRN